MLVWCLAATEVVSALARKQREGALDARTFRVAKHRLQSLESAWNEVIRWDEVRARARRLLEAHPLRTSDALHLAAALVAVEERPQGFELVTLDERLAEAAAREGFTVLPKQS
jgi:predicted nucleic acid-binding protein